MNDTAAISASDMRKLLRVDPAGVNTNYDGYKFREVMVRLPSGMIADDLKEPEIWNKVQQSVKALRKFDRLVIVSFDETWMAEAYVENADSEKALLARPRLITLSERTEKLFSDGVYRIEWTGFGYRVMRIRDGAAMTEAFANVPLAERALANMYPRRA
jgi:hypothetical protein